MNDVKIGIIGGYRAWSVAARFLKWKGYIVHISGETEELILTKMARTCQVVVVSVPIGVYPWRHREVVPLMRADSLLMDLTSLKKNL